MSEKIVQLNEEVINGARDLGYESPQKFQGQISHLMLPSRLFQVRGKPLSVGRVN